jgi:hypothetical protein
MSRRETRAIAALDDREEPQGQADGQDRDHRGSTLRTARSGIRGESSPRRASRGDAPRKRPRQPRGPMAVNTTVQAGLSNGFKPTEFSRRAGFAIGLHRTDRRADAGRVKWLIPVGALIVGGVSYLVDMLVAFLAPDCPSRSTASWPSLRPSRRYGRSGTCS